MKNGHIVKFIAKYKLLKTQNREKEGQKDVQNSRQSKNENEKIKNLKRPYVEIGNGTHNNTNNEAVTY